jgi:hypothetical protein
LADQPDSPQGQDVPSELLDLFRFATTCLALRIPALKVAGDLLSGLEELRQRGVIPLEEMAQIRATTSGVTEEHIGRWAAGFAEGYRSAWAAATLHVLDTRGIEYSKHLFRPLYLCGDAGLLTRFLGPGRHREPRG